MASERDRHLTEEELLRYADGEIREGQSRISQHLLACWDCRGRLSDLEAAIKAIVQFRNNDFLPAVPNPPRPWENFEDRLRTRALQSRQQRFWNRIFWAALGAIHHHRAATAAGIVVAGATLAGMWLLHPPAVSASGELAKASAAESTANLSASNRIVHQRLRVRKTTRRDSRETLLEYGVWRGPNLFRVTASSTGAPVLKELEDIYETSGLNWHDPLSVIAFSKWRGRLIGAQDALNRTSDSTEIAVRTTVNQPVGSIQVAEITLRTSDYHAIHEHLETTESDYEITETHWDLVSPETSLVTRALGLKRESDLVVEVAMPAHDLLFWPIGVGDGFVVNAVLPDGISLGSLHDFSLRIRRTEVRPICTRRAISDLLTPARCSFRISAACTAAVAGRPSRFPFART